MAKITIIDNEISKRVFDFEIDDQSFTLPNANTVKSKTWETFLALPQDFTRYLWLIREISPGNSEQILSIIPVDDLETLIQFWLKNSGVDIKKVLEVFTLVETHEAALEADLRAKFHIDGLKEFLIRLSLREKYAIIRALLLDVSSRLVASYEGWDYTWSIEAKVMADLFDLEHKKAAGKRKIAPYSRPYKSDGESKSFTKNKPANNLNSYELLQKHRQGKK